MKQQCIFISFLFSILISKSVFAGNFYFQANGTIAAGTHQKIALNNEGAGGTLYGSYGSGLIGNLTAGYSLTNSISLEVTGSYLHGKHYLWNDNNTVFNTSLESQGRMLRIIPTIKIVCEKARISPWVKAGFVIGFSPNVTTEFSYERIDNSIGSKKGSGFFEMSGASNSALGGILGIGLNTKMSDKISVVVEANYIYQKFKPENYYYKCKEMEYDTDVPFDAEKQNLFLVCNLPGTSDFLRMMDESYQPFSSFGFGIGINVLLCNH